MLAAIGAGEPVYRWTTALNGFAAHLTDAQLAALDTQPGIAAIEADAVRPLAGRTSLAAVRGAAASPRLRGGAGVVIGVVDSGIAPDSPAFADVPGLGADPDDFAGACAEGEGWTADDCTRKVVGRPVVRRGLRHRPGPLLGVALRPRRARPRHPGLLGRRRQRRRQRPRRRPGRRPLRRRRSRRPGSPPTRPAGARPTPPDDGCSTADVVSAVDAAVADRVDVLNLALAGGERIDTLQRALLGAAEADIVVVGASGNAGRLGLRRPRRPVGHDGRLGRRPHVARRSRVPGGRSFTGGGRPAAVRGRAVLAQDAAAPGASRRDAGQCRQRRPRLPPGRRPHRGVPARRHRPHRQVRDRRPGRRPRHGAGQPAPRRGDRRLPRRPHRPPARPAPAGPSAAGWRATPTPGCGCPA